MQSEENLQSGVYFKKLNVSQFYETWIFSKTSNWRFLGVNK